MKKLILTSVAVLAVFLKVSVSAAAIQEGHFKRDDDHAFIKVTDGNAYGMIWRDHGKKSEISLYRIEEQDDGTQAWIKLTVNENQMVGTNVQSEAALTGSLIQRGSQYLSLSPTEYGRNNGDATRFILKESDEYSWLDLPKFTVVYKSEGESVVERRTNTMSDKKVDGSFELAGKSYHGNYLLRSPIPSVGTLHSIEPSSENESGRRLSRQIVAFVVRIQGHCILDSHESILFFNLAAPAKIDLNKIIN